MSQLFLGGCRLGQPRLFDGHKWLKRSIVSVRQQARSRIALQEKDKRPGRGGMDVFVVIGLCRRLSFRVACSSSFPFPRFPAGGVTEVVERNLERHDRTF